MTEGIRNFVVISHIDHGKSTLADRFLELTKTVEARKMRSQYLDQLELERERGITIKMAPVRMSYVLNSNSYVLNLIDTPGHSDFSYEVSRALTAVEGAILLVDVTKGIQAQTLSNFRLARKANLKIIGAVNKIDVPSASAENAARSLADLLGVPTSDIFRISAKTGEGVEALLEGIIRQLPPPRNIGQEYPLSPVTSKKLKALIFDSLYDEHRGILAFVRLFQGAVKAGDEVRLLAGGTKCKIKEVGFFSPELAPTGSLSAGAIGYVATGLKEPDLIKIGDTIAESADLSPLPGYQEPKSVMFLSLYPDSDTEFDDLKQGLAKLRLSDPALHAEQESNEALGRGLKVGFLGKLHFEITTSRLKDEFHLAFLTSFPSVAYRVQEGRKERIIKEAKDFPDKPTKVFQPTIALEILTPSLYLSQVVGLKNIFELEISEIKNVGENLLLIGKMPLAELLSDFDDKLKSVSAGFASFSYELAGEESAEVEKLELLIAGEALPALTRVIPAQDADREARRTVERLKELLPRQQFSQSIQARTHGRIIAREDIPALKKDVTGYLYGGDRTRKMKLWQKQKKGKEKLKKLGKVNLTPEVFREILKK